MGKKTLIRRERIKTILEHATVIGVLFMAAVALVVVVYMTSPIEPNYGQEPAALPPTYTPVWQESEQPLVPGLTIQAIDPPGASVRIEEVRVEKCSGMRIFAIEQLVVFYTTNYYLYQDPRTFSFCIPLGEQDTFADSRITVRSVIEDNQQRWLLVVPKGWRVVSP